MVELRNPGKHPSLEDLKTITPFQGLRDQDLQWLAEHFSNETFQSGEILVREGETSDLMLAIFEGELQGRRDSLGQEAPLYIARAGTVTGKLPFSRMKQYGATVRAMGLIRIGRMHESAFPEMLQAIPEIGERLVGVLSDRVREVAKVDQNREKLAALGKLSAGLAHELNNPASAATRASGNLREALALLAEANRKMATCPMTEEQRDMLAQFESEVTRRMDSNPVLDTLEQSDREQELIDWFDTHSIPGGWEMAAVLADSGVDQSCLDQVNEMVGAKMLGSVLRRTSATLNVERLLREIENSMERITTLVRAVKEYSYMDRSNEQEIDIHRGLDNTLAMLTHKLKSGVRVVRQYDKSIPKIVINGGELNQVWTNIIDNAVDAMKCTGELRIRTARENDVVLVEITDSGPGIPQEIQSRIFDPFFTTKGVGSGTGLGLDFVYRIVGRMHGDVRFTSKAGETSFQIRLPLVQPKPDPQHEEVLSHQADT